MPMDMDADTGHPWLEIVGCGPGGTEYVTPAARAVVARAEAVFGWRRCLDLFPEAGGRRKETGGLADLLDRIAEAESRGLRVAALVTGDVGIFSLAQTLIKRFGPAACRLTPGISAVQVACARLGLDWADAYIVNAHGREPSEAETARLDACRLSVVYLDKGVGRTWAARQVGRLAASHRAYVCERLTLPDERIFPADAATAAEAESPALVVFHRRGDTHTGSGRKTGK